MESERRQTNENEKATIYIKLQMNYHEMTKAIDE